MKRFLLFALPVLLLSACQKEVVVIPVVDEGDWIYRERAVVVYSDYRCDWYVVETQSGYSVLRSRDGVLPYEGSVMYGDFSSWGVHPFYNRSERYLTRADVKDYWLGYYDAIDEANYQCSR
jgi:hypothetical protein